MDPLSGENPNKIDNEFISYIFKPDRDNFPRKPYDQEGNPEMYTKENVEKRKALRNNPIVVDAIENFAKKSQLFNWSGGKQNPVISKEEYFRVFVKVGMLLRPGIDSDELTVKIKEDFDNDSQD